jgi:DNA transformation protein
MSATSPDSPEPSSERLTELAALPGLGPESAAALGRAGIVSVAALRRIGAVRAFVRVREAGGRPSLNLLWALEGALTGVDWKVVARTERTRLLFELDDQTRRQHPRRISRRRRSGEG